MMFFIFILLSDLNNMLFNLKEKQHIMMYAVLYCYVFTSQTWLTKL